LFQFRFGISRSALAPVDDIYQPERASLRLATESH